MVLGVVGGMADGNCKLLHNHSNHSEPGGQMDGKWQGIAARPEPGDLVYCTNAHKGNRTLFGNSGGAGMGVENEDENADERKRASSCAGAVSVCVGPAGGEVRHNTTAVLCGK
jgi:hypothetical protein